MKQILIVISLLIASTTNGFAMDSLAELKWNKRILVLFAEDGSSRLKQQVDLLKNRTPEMDDRDMLVLQVSETDVKSVYGEAPRLDAAALRAEAGIAGSDFTAVLIGKDGGEKLRSNDVLKEKDIFDLIDSMPMRRAGQK